MQTIDFDYLLPHQLIAQTPLQKRDNSKLLVYNKLSNEITHTEFFNIIDFLNAGDLLVINETRVIPARVFGVKRDTGAKVELLLHKCIKDKVWQVLAKPAKRLVVGTILDFYDNGAINNNAIDGDHQDSNSMSAMHHNTPLATCQVLEKIDNGELVVEWKYNGVLEEILAVIGTMPLPPYIKTKLLKDNQDRYQTVYAKSGQSAASPTAGLHFTTELLNAITQKGVKIVPINLTVGLGTFMPVKSIDITDHKMHSEAYSIPKTSAELINNQKSSGGKIIAIGTTSARAVESATDNAGVVQAKTQSTDIFIYPPYKFKTINGLVTNFHLPKSTLLMLVSAFIGREKVLELYNNAIQQEYRFFSFGDAMFIT